MTLITLINRLGLARDQMQSIRAQAKLIRDQQNEIRRLHLEYTKEIHGLACAWMLSLEQPEIDMRDSLFAMNIALADQISTLEEHVL
jgi:hypothetical protein